MNLSKLTKASLIIELEKRFLPTNGLKDDLLKRLKEAIEKESVSEQDIQEENYDSEDENVEDVVSEDKLESNQDLYPLDKSNETLNDEDIVKEIDSTTELTVDDAINMKSTADAENYSMIVNVNDDDNSMPNSINDRTMDYEQTSGSRDIDNGEHEVIEISEEVIIDDEDNQDNDNNYNEEHFHNDQAQQDKDDLESGESREEDNIVINEKITLWVHNVAEDVKAVDLKELFGKYGKVTSAKVVMNGKDATGNCFGCIELCNSEDAENCINHLDKTEFRGNTITVSKNICVLAPKETIQRNISPVSSTDSWGGDGKKKEKSKSFSPFVGPSATEDNKDDDKAEDNNSSNYKAPYRGRAGYRGNNYSNRDDSKSYGQDSYRGQRGGQDYRRGNDSRNNYNSRPDKYGDDASKSRNYRGESDNRSRDTYIRRGGSGRDDYGSKGGDSRYPPSISRDKYSSRESGAVVYGDRSSRGSRYHDDNYRDSRARYGHYDGGHQEYHQDRRVEKRPFSTQDRPRESYYSVGSSRRDIDVSFKRPRPDNDSDYYSVKSRRREEYSPVRPSVGSTGQLRDRYRAPSPIKQRDSYHHHHNRSRSRDPYPAPHLSTDRRPIPEYVSRKPPGDYARPSSTARGQCSPPRSSNAVRSHNYSSKESYPPTDFGGRSRNYDR